MGKLHSLRKEIKKSPEDWYFLADMSVTIFGKVPLAAVRIGGKWSPASYRRRGTNTYSYALFVRDVLWDIGIKTDKPRSVQNIYKWSGHRARRHII